MNNNQQPERARDFLPRLRAFKVAHSPATAHRSERVRIKDMSTGKTSFVSFCYTTGSIVDQAYNYLHECGIEIEHMVPVGGTYFLTTNDHETELI